MAKKTLIVFFIFTFFIARILNSADSEGNYEVYGDGNIVCSQYIQFYSDNSPKLKDISIWLSGYLTAYNLLNDETNSISGPWRIETQMEWIFDYCRISDNSDVANAAQSLTNFLYERKIETSPKGL